VQCYQCNHPLEGNREEYKKGLAKKYGTGIIEHLELQAHNKSLLDVSLCMILKKQYRQKWQELESEYLPKFRL